MSRGRIALLALALAAALAAGPARRTAGAAPARRIVSLSPAATEILFAIGAGDRLVGVCSFCDYPPAVKGIPRVGSFVTPSIETIVAARPDLVIAAHGPATWEAVEAVRRIGVPVLVVEDTTLAAVWKAIADIGQRTGLEARATAVAAGLRERLEAGSGRRPSSWPASARSSTTSCARPAARTSPPTPGFRIRV
jgi:iron complex transport system substrate-binding protein